MQKLQKYNRYQKTELGEFPMDWQILRIEDIAEVKGRIGWKGMTTRDYRAEGPILIGVTNISKDFKLNLNQVTRISEERYEESPEIIVQINDILLAKSGATTGKVCYVEKLLNRATVNAAVNILRCKNDLILAKFFYHFLTWNVIQKILFLKSSAGAQPNLFQRDTRKIPVILPSLPEQQKIALILSNVDDLLQKTNQIIEQSQRLKKGLMQTLLNRGIKHTKFEKVVWNYGKILDIPKGWNVVLLDNATQRGTGHTPDAKKPEYYNGGIKWVSLADSNKLDNIYISQTTKEISNKGIENSSAVLHPAGTVIMSRDAGIGKSAILKTEMAVSQHFVTWRCGKNLNNFFLYYLLQYWKPLFESIAIGTTIKTIGLPFFKKLRIPLPPLDEQLKIVSFLSSVEDNIKANHNLRNRCRNLKKGLMQQLLTGKIRVKN